MSWQNNPGPQGPDQQGPQPNPGQDQPSGSGQWQQPQQPGPHQQPQQPGFPQAGPAGQRFGASGSAPGGFPGAVTKMEEPQASKIAKLLVLASAAVMVVNAILQMVILDVRGIVTSSFVEIDTTGTGVTEQEVIDGVAGAVSTLAYGIAAFVLLISLGLYALVYFGMRANKNWARILGIIFAILGGLSSLGTLLTSFGHVDTAGMIIDLLAGLLGTAIAVYFLVLVFRKDVADWYRVQSLPKF